MSQDARCPACGEGRLVASTITETREVANLEFASEVAAERCDACGEVFTESAALERFELGVAAELAMAGARSGSALRFMRTALGLRSAELAGILDVRPETYSRWETGDQEPPVHVMVLVGRIAQDRLDGTSRTIEALQAVGSPRKKMNVTIQLPPRAA